MLKQTLLGSMAATALVLGSPLAAEASASAASPETVTPAGVACQFYTSGNTAESVICTGTTLQYRVFADCNDPLRDSTSTFYGSYVSSPNRSAVHCPYSGNVQWILTGRHGVQFR
jgi:hypothetical protein